ncbi:MAG: sigma-70 family RNA polymerase sigma factor [Prevotella sp.]|nr:sigma-70 family RNA polymerase sigma factor [Prevotella sp.]
MILPFARHRKEAQYELMFKDMYPKLVRYACQLMGDMEEAKDIVSGVMQTAWERFDSAGTLACNAWLYTATRNAVLNRMKHLKVEQDKIDSIIRATQADADDDYAHHEQLLQTAERIADELGEPTRTILRRCYWERKTYTQVATELGISPNTVKKHISKALATLRAKMN